MHDIIILGSGPAGLTAAIYTARANLQPLLFEGSLPGGQLTMTTTIENFPGFPQGIQGNELMSQMKEQAASFGTQILADEVERVDLSQRPFQVSTANDTFHCRALIVATGASAKLIGLESEKKLLGHGVSTCATCDGFFFRGQQVAVLGGGDSALEEALFLTRYASKVFLVHRRDKFRASKILQDRVSKNEKIELVMDSVVQEIRDVSLRTVQGIRLKNIKTEKLFDIPVEGVFVAIGHQPNTHLFQGQLELDDLGYIVIQNGAQTNIAGVFAAGDVHDTRYRQAITAAAAGCRAALDAEKYLDSIEGQSF